METVTAEEAASRWAELLERVRQGESVTILQNGAEVARLVPAPQPSNRELLEQWLEVRRRVSTGGIPIRQLIEEGRKY